MRPVLIGVLLWAAGAQAAEVRFTPRFDTQDAAVTIKIDRFSREFRMPAWAPGDYDLFNYGQFVENPQFFRRGSMVPSTRGVDLNAWTIPDGADEVRYVIKPSRGNFTVNLRVKSDEVFVSGPGVFGWFQGHQRQTHTLTLDLPDSFTAVVPLPKGAARNVWRAANYDELIDSPFAVGTKLKVAEKSVRGKLHRFVSLNPTVNSDPNVFLSVGVKAAEQAFQIFGELPYPEYTFFGDFGGGGGSLEHANSTRLGLYSTNPAQSMGTIFHEHFHAFNVKRIRAAPLGPFDYSKPAVTGTLWWLEGVTDYYAEVLLVRAGLITRDQFLQSASSRLLGLSRSPASLRVSADEASRRVWETRGSFGFGGMSYYTKGYGVGVVLDLAIRQATEGTKSLDDVMRALYAETKAGPGFKELRIRELCVQIGGPTLGDIYDTAVMKAVDLPVRDAVRGTGFRWGSTGLERDPDSVEYERVGARYPLSLREPIP